MSLACMGFDHYLIIEYFLLCKIKFKSQLNDVYGLLAFLTLLLSICPFSDICDLVDLNHPAMISCKETIRLAVWLLGVFCFSTVWRSGCFISLSGNCLEGLFGHSWSFFQHFNECQMVQSLDLMDDDVGFEELSRGIVMVFGEGHTGFLSCSFY